MCSFPMSLPEDKLTTPTATRSSVRIGEPDMPAAMPPRASEIMMPGKLIEVAVDAAFEPFSRLVRQSCDRGCVRRYVRSGASLP